MSNTPSSALTRKHKWGNDLSSKTGKERLRSVLVHSIAITRFSL